MRRLLLPSMLIGLTAILAGCIPSRDGPSPVPLIGGRDNLSGGIKAPPTFDEFAGSVRSGNGDISLGAQRFSAMKEAALAYSAQAGYARRSWEIFRQLETKAPELSSQFDFNDVVYRAPKEAGYVIPPVVSRAKEAITITKHGRESVAADEYYRIVKPGHLAGVVPTWRDYLIMGVDKTPDPADQFLPTSSKERKIWKHYMAEGWKQGEVQADAALKANMNRLRRHYQGMIEYRRLVDAGLIKSMVVRASEVRASGTPRELFIGQPRVKIVSSARFNRNPAQWKPVKRRFAVTKP